MQWTRRHLLGLEELSAEEITFILDRADSFKEICTRPNKKVPALSGRTIVNMFFENSTRTNLSFQLAARRLSADVLMFSKTGTSVAKGETMIDTALNIEAMGVDVMVLRHGASGAPWKLARSVSCAVVNAGDGQHEHPTQALLDLYTIREVRGRIAGLTVGIVGDIAHSRVARSNIWGLTKLGARVMLVGPTTLMPRDIERMGVSGVEVCHDMNKAIRECDVLNMLRIQFERQGDRPFPSIREYIQMFGLTRERLRKGRDDLVVMHPGPVNRGVEISPEVADGPQSVILRQVANGLAVRMAVLQLVNGAEPAAGREERPWRQ
ncbi:MAG: aspartate carbamoyltransferase catalytic subunit [Planctomycetota bacterium]|jgi:aspartate carbamoyltransferase catalytic subunit|nr:aspartate carbamoyltransferase catalytic subunit [Planctomycetota bacterium]